MTRAFAPRFGRLIVLAGIFAGLSLGLLSLAGTHRLAVAGAKAQPKPINHPSPEEMKSLKLIGAVECKSCHSEVDPKEKELYQQTLGYEFIRLWENKVWAVHDLHSAAYKNLLTSRTVKKEKKEVPNKIAQQMEDNLRRIKGEQYTIATDTACLACHASAKQPMSLAPPEKWTLTSFSTTDGVGCEMCHGHGSLYQYRHQASEEGNTPEGATRVVPWRETNPKIKAEWGLVDLRDSATATERCASCHIGNEKEGRFVTHDMFAAGHPPLPPLDLVAFTREQPRHWGLPVEKELPYFGKLLKNDAKKAEAIFHVRAGESHVARRLAESTIAVLRASVTLGEQLAEKSKDQGLDFAAFDCASCHHDLKYPSDRQNRGYAGKPGRPLYRPAAFALTRIIVEHASEMEGGGEFKKALEKLNELDKKLLDAFTDKTLGDPARIAAASAEVRAWCNNTLTKLATVRYTPKETRTLLVKVRSATQQMVADPDIAQLYTWAFETLVIDQIPPTEGKDGKTPPKEVTELLTELHDIVVTQLRDHPGFYYEVAGGAKGENLKPVADRIGPRMKTYNSFRYAQFQKAFQDLKLEFPK